MKRLLCACLLAVLACSSTGCTLLRKKTSAPKKPKPVTSLAADTDKQFRALWIAQRQKELEAGGLTGTAAAARAGEEYVAKYGYTSSAR
jgi:uncharacterized lipoprotein YddW (UPF0748 family)